MILFAYYDAEKMDHPLLEKNLAAVRGAYLRKNSGVEFGSWERFDNQPCEDGTLKSGYKCKIVRAA